MARKRMMAAVPKATVVVTNPTHFAVALEWDELKMAAPVLTAKGADLIAKRIRDLAVEHDVPILENAPLARTLYAKVELDSPVPPDLYAAVAQVIAFVFKLQEQDDRLNVTVDRCFSCRSSGTRACRASRSSSWLELYVSPEAYAVVGCVPALAVNVTLPPADDVQVTLNVCDPFVAGGVVCEIGVNVTIAAGDAVMVTGPLSYAVPGMTI